MTLPACEISCETYVARAQRGPIFLFGAFFALGQRDPQNSAQIIYCCAQRSDTRQTQCGATGQPPERIQSFEPLLRCGGSGAPVFCRPSNRAWPNSARFCCTEQNVHCLSPTHTVLRNVSRSAQAQSHKRSTPGWRRPADADLIKLFL